MILSIFDLCQVVLYLKFRYCLKKWTENVELTELERNNLLNNPLLLIDINNFLKVQNFVVIGKLLRP